MKPKRQSFYYTKMSRLFWEESSRYDLVDKLLLEYLQSGDTKKEMFAISQITNFMMIPASKIYEVQETTATIDATNRDAVIAAIKEKVNDISTKTETNPE